MLWSLLSSVYVIYLYRKLNAERAPHAAQSPGDAGALIAEVETLNQRLDAIETRLHATKAQETAR
jgi:hypothetical protein